MNTSPASGDGAPEQKIYGAAQSSGSTLPEAVSDGPAPPYTAPYPPYLTTDAPSVGSLSVPVASGLAYVTIIPAVFFLLLQPYRSNATIRFHSWQSIFYFLTLAAARVLESLMVAILPSVAAFAVSALLSLALFAGWLVAIIKAFQGVKVHLLFIGDYAERTASTHSVRN